KDRTERPLRPGAEVTAGVGVAEVDLPHVVVEEVRTPGPEVFVLLADLLVTEDAGHVVRPIPERMPVVEEGAERRLHPRDVALLQPVGPPGRAFRWPGGDVARVGGELLPVLDVV